MSVPTTWTVVSLSVGVFGVMSHELFLYVFIVYPCLGGGFVVVFLWFVTCIVFKYCYCGIFSFCSWSRGM